MRGALAHGSGSPSGSVLKRACASMIHTAQADQGGLGLLPVQVCSLDQAMLPAMSSLDGLLHVLLGFRV